MIPKLTRQNGRACTPRASLSDPAQQLGLEGAKRLDRAVLTRSGEASRKLLRTVPRDRFIAVDNCLIGRAGEVLRSPKSSPE